MTNREQIIIDGVNVSGCEYFRPNSTLTCSRGYGGSCDNKYSDKQCYSKQLARKTQECDNWKHQAELGSGPTDRLSKQLEEKMQECEELKEKNAKLEKKLELIPCANEALQIGYTAYKKQTEYLLGKSDRYRKALEEIEEIVKELKRDICNNCGWYNTDNCNPIGNVCGDLIKILDIINKAKGCE